MSTNNKDRIPFRRVSRGRKLTAEEAVEDRRLRDLAERDFREGRVRWTGRTMGDLFEVRSLLGELARARAASGVSLAELSRRTGIAESALSRLESGKNDNPTVSTLARYARGLGKQLRLEVEELEPVESARP